MITKTEWKKSGDEVEFTDLSCTVKDTEVAGCYPQKPGVVHRCEEVGGDDCGVAMAAALAAGSLGHCPPSLTPSPSATPACPCTASR